MPERDYPQHHGLAALEFVPGLSKKMESFRYNALALAKESRPFYLGPSPQPRCQSTTRCCTSDRRRLRGPPSHRRRLRPCTECSEESDHVWNTPHNCVLSPPG